jgi:hypothetical protein
MRMFDGVLVGLMAACSFPFSYGTKKVRRQSACNGKEHTAIKPTGTPKQLKSLANRVAVSSQKNLHTRLTCYIGETALLLHEICIDKHWTEIYP